MLEFIIAFYSFVGLWIGFTLLSIVLLLVPILIIYVLGRFLWELRPSQWTNDKPWLRVYND